MSQPLHVSSARHLLWHRWGVWLQAILFGANLVLSCLGLGGFPPLVQVYGLALCSLLVCTHLLLRATGLARAHLRFGLADGCFAAFLILAAFNAEHVSPFVWLGRGDLIAWTQLFACFWILRSECTGAGPRRFLWVLLLSLGVLGVILGLYQRFVDPRWLMLGRTQVDQFLHRASGFFGIPNSLAGFLLLLIPSSVAACLRPGAPIAQRVLFAYLSVLFLLGLVLTITRGAWLSLALALAAWPLLQSGRKGLSRYGFSALVLCAFLGLTVLLQHHSPAVRDRLEALSRDAGETSRPVLWNAAWTLFKEDPWTGKGAGSFDLLFERHRPEPFQTRAQWAHNEYLQVLTEYGLPGMLLLSVGCLLFYHRFLREPLVAEPEGASPYWGTLRHRWVRQGFVVGLIAFCLHLFLEFHLKLPGLALAFVAAVLLALPEEPRSRPSAVQGTLREGWPWLLAAFGAAALSWFGCLPLLRAEALRHSARTAFEKRLPGLAGTPAALQLLGSSEASLREAVRLCPSHGGAWADFAYVLALEARERPAKIRTLGLEAERAADRALALSREHPEFWLRKGVALDMQGRWLEAGPCFVRALTLAPASSNARYYLAYHYSLRPSTRALARALIANCLRLDLSHAPAQNLAAQMASIQDTR